MEAHLATSVRQVQTPLNCMFFSQQNIQLLQRAIRQDFKNKTGVKIDYQNQDDLISLMRSVYINNQQNSYDKLDQQIRQMNGVVIKQAVDQISTGVSQFFAYVRDLDKPIVPPAIPENTSIYGMRIDKNVKNTL